MTVNIDRPEMLDAAFRKLIDAKVQAVTSTLLSTRNNLEKEYAQAALATSCRRCSNSNSARGKTTY